MTAALRIATRDSQPALRRARAVQAMLAARDVPSELVQVRTAGDKRFEEPTSLAATKHAFTKELEHALHRRAADVAVHDYQDVATDPPQEFAIAAVLERADPRDALVLSRLVEAEGLAELPRGSRIGSSSVRCRSLLRAMYRDIEVVHLRGGLAVRLHKVDDGQAHGTIVSAAVLHLMEISQRVAACLEAPEWLPAPAQGATVLQVRAEDDATHALLAPLDHARTRLDTAAERAVLASLEGGLQSPVGALVVRDAAGAALHGVVADERGDRLLRASLPMDDADPELVGVRVGNELRTLGASAILDELRGTDRLPAPQPDR
jgi:hydroxymethylbilane synthase